STGSDTMRKFRSCNGLNYLWRHGRATARNLLQHVEQPQAALAGLKRRGEGNGLEMRAGLDGVFDQANAFKKNVMVLAAAAHLAKAFDQWVLSAGDFFNEHERWPSIGRP